MTDAVEVFGADREGRWVITCDHASNRVPDDVCDGDLGLPAADMARHIAYDVGAEGVARAMGEVMNGPVAASRFSRLVIDPNRGENDPTLLMQIYDGSIIAGNRGVTAQEVERRVDRFHRPYHAAVASLLALRADPIIVSIHSFTPQLQGRTPRPWHVSVLHTGDTRLANPMLARLRMEEDLCVGEDEPYKGHLPGDALDQHALQQERLHVLLEVRNDLIEAPADQRIWGHRLAQLLDETVASAEV